MLNLTLLSVAATAAEHGAKPGMPQLDASSFTSQIFWLFVTFVLLFVIMKTRVVPKVSTIIETREARINDDLGTAASLKQQAEDARQQYEAAMNTSRATALSIVAETQKEARAAITAKIAEVDSAAATRLAQAEQAIAKSAGAARGKAGGDAAQLADMILVKLGITNTTRAEIDAAVGKLAGKQGA